MLLYLTAPLAAQEAWTWKDSTGRRHFRADVDVILEQSAKAKKAELGSANLAGADLSGANLLARI